MTQRRRVPTGARWAEVVSYSRAVRVGDTVHVSGTVSVDDAGAIMHRGDAGAQARRALEIIEQALEQVGATRSDVVRTRMFVVDRKYWEEVGRVHGEFFRGIDPATSMLFAGLIDEELLVEIEAEAVITS